MGYNRLAMVNPLAVVIYSHKSGYQGLLERQLKKAGIDRQDSVLGDFSWRARLLEIWAISEQLQHRYLIFLDAWDQTLMGTKEEIQTLVAKRGLEEHVLLAAEKVCWPDADKAKQFEKKSSWNPHSPWNYINSSPLCGLGYNIARAIEAGEARFPLKGTARTVHDPSGEVCERFWTDLYLYGPERGLKIDTECEMNQIMIKWKPGDLDVIVKDGRLFNVVTGTWPIFSHFNGGGTLPEGMLL